MPPSSRTPSAEGCKKSRTLSREHAAPTTQQSWNPPATIIEAGSRCRDLWRRQQCEQVFMRCRPGQGGEAISLHRRLVVTAHWRDAQALHPACMVGPPTCGDPKPQTPYMAPFGCHQKPWTSLSPKPQNPKPQNPKTLKPQNPKTLKP